MASTPSPTSKTTGSKGKPNKNSNDIIGIDPLDKKQPSNKRSQLVRRSSTKSVSTRSSTSSIKSGTSNTSQSPKVKRGKKKSTKRQKANVSNETEKQSPIHIEKTVMGQNQSQTETKTDETSAEKKQLETSDIDFAISDSSSDDQTNSVKNNISDEKLIKSRVVLKRIDESTVSSGPKSRVVLKRINESTVFSGPDNMKPIHSKRKTLEHDFGDTTVTAKRSNVSQVAKKNNPQRTEMVSNKPADLLLTESSSLSDDLCFDENDAVENAMNEITNDNYDLELDSSFTDLGMFDTLALTADEPAVCLEYQNLAVENSSQNAETIEDDFQATSNMNSTFDVDQPINEKRDQPDFESDTEDGDTGNGDEHESDGETDSKNGRSRNEGGTNAGTSLFDHSENGESDDDVISIMGHDEDDPLLEADITENANYQSKNRQMQMPRWKNQQSTKTNVVPKLIPGSALIKGTAGPTKSPRPISQILTSTAIKIKDLAKQNDSIGTFSRIIPNNLPPTPSSRDPREQKRLMLAAKQNVMHNDQLFVDSQLPSTSNAMQPPAALPPRKPVHERLGLRKTNVAVNQTINKNKKIPSLMSVNPFPTALKIPVETQISDIPNLPAYLPRDEPQGEVLPELDVDNTPQTPKVPELPQIPRVNIKESLILPAFYQSPEQYRPVFGFLFSKVCRPFMSDDCSKNPNQCEFEHRLTDVELFASLIEKMLVDDIVETYETFMLRIPKLFDAYFQVLLSYFAKKKRNDVLKRMIIDCDIRFKQHFFPIIVKCFMEMGESYSKALAGLIQTIKNRTTKTSHEIVKMILDGRNTNIKPFINVLLRIADQKSYKYSIDHTNRLLRIFDSTKNAQLAKVIWKITEDINMAKSLDPEFLKKFVCFYSKAPATQ